MACVLGLVCGTGRVGLRADVGSWLCAGLVHASGGQVRISAAFSHCVQQHTMNYSYFPPSKHQVVIPVRHPASEISNTGESRGNKLFDK